MTRELVTVEEVSSLANSLTAENIEAAVAALDPADVPVYAAKLVDAASRNRVLLKAIEQRLAADGQAGEHFMVDGVEYVFLGVQRRGYQEIPSLFRFLIEDCAVSPIALAEAVNDMRVTSLRDVLRQIPDPEKRTAALEELEAHRIEVGARGSPHFQLATTYVK